MKNMLARLAPLALALSLVGCATTARSAADELAAGPRKAKKCRHHAVTGTRILKRICENDAPEHNLVGMSGEELRRNTPKSRPFIVE